MRVLLLVLLLLMHNNAYSAGPKLIATADRQLWLEPINTIEAFDKASRAMLLVYIATLQTMQVLSDTELKTAFNSKSVNHASVMQWLNKELALASLNYQRASVYCHSTDWSCIADISNIKVLSNIPAEYQAWLINTKTFAQVYINEQLRLAALFPKISSEIALFNTHEWNGDNFADRQFLLSFDDGPSAARGNTDITLTMLAQAKKSAVFFLLGENVQSRLQHSDIKTWQQLYAGQCVAAHGWQHQSHATGSDWQRSIQQTNALLKSSFTTVEITVLPWFRPPYGQRKADSGAFFQAHGLQVALWNIDSQDWNNQVNADAIVNRIVSLMLIKRHGVLLFHDVHAKAALALPQIFQAVGDAVTWSQCATTV